MTCSQQSAIYLRFPYPQHLIPRSRSGLQRGPSRLHFLSKCIQASVAKGAMFPLTICGGLQSITLHHLARECGSLPLTRSQDALPGRSQVLSRLRTGKKLAACALSVLGMSDFRCSAWISLGQIMTECDGRSRKSNRRLLSRPQQQIFGLVLSGMSFGPRCKTRSEWCSVWMHSQSGQRGRAPTSHLRNTSLLNCRMPKCTIFLRIPAA